ncbi:CpaF family protein [Solirhodobacter olei]|uniref:CpaF family protein n=1 Tax=Solirhodobacter olei TaxID=2493082 RepID=UPI000FDB2D36|nr:CpaF family protein [Solirhodobacter olei]
MFKQFAKPTAKSVSNVVELSPALSPDSQRAHFVEDQPDSDLLARLELKTRLHEVLLERLNLAVIDKVEPEELHREVSSVVSQVLAEEKRPMRGEDVRNLVNELLDEILGYGPLEPLLADPTISDILVNSYRSVYVERAGVLEKSRVRFRDERHLMRIIDKIVSRVGRRVDESQPWVDARLEDGSRFNAIIRPCAIDGPSVSIRKFAKMPYTMERLIECGALSHSAAGFLKALVQARLNVLISGGTGSGKTTMLNAMSSYIGGRERIVTIEDAAELQLQQEHVVRLETRPPSPSGTGNVTQRDLVRNALRMRPDRIIVGEVRGAEAFDMLQAMNTGHEGSMTTVHANSPRDALMRVEQMVTMTGIDLPVQSIRGNVVSALNIVLQLSRLSDGRRRVLAISEITGMEGNTITMQDIFVFLRGGIVNGEVQGEFVPTGIRPQCYGRLVSAGVELPAETFVRKGVMV